MSGRHRLHGYQQALVLDDHDHAPGLLAHHDEVPEQPDALVADQLIHRARLGLDLLDRGITPGGMAGRIPVDGAKLKQRSLRINAGR